MWRWVSLVEQTLLIFLFFFLFFLFLHSECNKLNKTNTHKSNDVLERKLVGQNRQRSYRTTKQISVRVFHVQRTFCANCVSAAVEQR